MTHTEKLKVVLSYDRPWDRKQLMAKNYEHLLADPAHAWRADNGIELIHKEPTRAELERIWKNWQLMSDTQKKESDRQSLKLFGKTNTDNYAELTKSAVSFRGISIIRDISKLRPALTRAVTRNAALEPGMYQTANEFGHSMFSRQSTLPTIPQAVDDFYKNLTGPRVGGGHIAMSAPNGGSSIFLNTKSPLFGGNRVGYRQVIAHEAAHDGFLGGGGRFGGWNPDSELYPRYMQGASVKGNPVRKFVSGAKEVGRYIFEDAANYPDNGVQRLAQAVPTLYEATKRIYSIPGMIRSSMDLARRNPFRL